MDGPFVGQEAAFPPVNNFYILAKGVDRSQRSGKLSLTVLVTIVGLTFAGLYRSGPRVDPQIGNRYYRYPDHAEATQGAAPDRAHGSPIRSSSSRGVFDARLAHATVQRHPTNHREPRSD